MPGPRLPVRKIRDVLRLSAAGMSKRQIAVSLGVSATAARDCILRARRAGLASPLPEGLTDETLEDRLYPPPAVAGKERRPRPDWATVHRELRRPGVTLQLLWEEHRAARPDGYGYSRYCELYRAWEGRLSPTVRQSHIAGERMFVDYAGTTLAVIDGLSGEARTAQLFVAVLGASNYTYAEATWTQGLSDWIGSHTRAFAFIGGVPAMVGSANLRAGVTKAWFYEPAINRTYAEMAAQYNTHIVPARPYRARDKAKVEVAVQVATRFIIAKLRNQQFFSLSALNAAIAELVAQINNRASRHLGASRRALFEDLEQSALKPLPAEPYVFAEWKQCRVGLDSTSTTTRCRTSCCARRCGRASPRADRSLPPRQARCRACAVIGEPQAYDGARAHAVEPSALCRLDAGAPAPAGRCDRTQYLGLGRDHPAGTRTSRARLPRLRRHRPALVPVVWTASLASDAAPGTPVTKQMALWRLALASSMIFSRQVVVSLRILGPRVRPGDFFHAMALVERLGSFEDGRNTPLARTKRIFARGGRDRSNIPTFAKTLPHRMPDDRNLSKVLVPSPLHVNPFKAAPPKCPNFALASFTRRS